MTYLPTHETSPAFKRNAESKTPIATNMAFVCLSICKRCTFCQNGARCCVLKPNTNAMSRFRMLLVFDRLRPPKFPKIRCPVWAPQAAFHWNSGQRVGDRAKLCIERYCEGSFYWCNLWHWCRCTAPRPHCVPVSSVSC